MSRHKSQRILFAATATAGLCAAASVASAQPTIDGSRDQTYISFATQTVNTEFGDNQSELNNGYFHIQDGKLYLFLGGNLESNFNKLVIFFDTRPGGQNVMRGDNPDIDFNNVNTKYEGMTFDAGFAPDYMLFYSRDPNDVYLNFTELNTNGGGLGGYLGSVATPNPNQQGSGVVGGSGGLPVVEFGYNDSNTAGVVGGSDAADQTAAAAVATGSELSIELPQIGATENFRIMIGINGSSHDFWSNQFLPGLMPPQGNLGGDGMGNYTGTVSDVNFNNIAGEQFLTINYHAPLSQWLAAGGGNWSQAGNWTGDGVPNARDARAVLGTAGGSAARTITLDTDVRLQSLTFDSPGSYTLTGSNTLTIAGNPASPAVHVISGSHTIDVPLVLGSTTNFSVEPFASVLTVSGPMTATGQTIVKTGAGTVRFNNVRADRLFISEGTVQVAPNGTEAGRSTVNSLGISGDSVPTARLDITNNAFVIDYTGEDNSPLATVKSQIISAYNGGAWNGQGITSSNANSTQFGVAYAEANTLTNVPAVFGTVDTDAVLLRLTRYGDSNLDGTVNLADFNALAANFGSGDADWRDGDFNYDGIVNLADFNRLAANFGLAAAGPDVTPDDWAALAAAVPEPASIGLYGVASLALLRRRRRA